MSFPRPTPVEWLCLLCGLFLTIHYSWVMDDAFVYFRYVDNFLFLDSGITYNRGEFVEGYSSAFWFKVLTALRWTRLDFWLITRLLGVAIFALFWAGLVVVNRKLSPGGLTRASDGPAGDSAGERVAVVNLPLVLLSFNYAVLCYFTSGLETPAVQLAAVLYALFVLKPESRTWQVLLGLTPMLRHELALPFLVCLAWFVWRRRRVPWAMVLTAAAYIGAWGLFRIEYYADILPNTFYLKDESNWVQGLRFLHDTLVIYHMYVLLPGLVLLLLVLRRRAASASELLMEPRLVMLACALGIAVYVIRIGGDPRHYRYLAFPYCLGLALFGGVAERGLALALRRARPLAAASLGLTLAALTFAAYPMQLAEHPAFNLDVENEQIESINDAAYHRVRFRAEKAMRFLPWGMSTLDQIPRYERYLENHEPFAYDGWICSAWCADHYLEFHHRAVQSLGLTDGFLSRTQMNSKRPAHKEGLKPLANDIMRIQMAAPELIGRGMYRAAIEREPFPPWVKRNIEMFEWVELKVYNEHRFLENLKLAFTFPKKMLPGRYKEW